MDSRDTLTQAEALAFGVIFLAGEDGADLAGETRPERSQVHSTTARRLAKAGIVAIDAGARARLTDKGRQLAGS